MTKGKVYTAQISRKDLSRMKENYTLTSMLTQGNNVTVRFLAEQPPKIRATACEPQVEDAYLYLMQEKEGFSHDLDVVLKRNVRMLWKSLIFWLYILAVALFFFQPDGERSPLNQSLSQSRKEAMA